MISRLMLFALVTAITTACSGPPSPTTPTPAAPPTESPAPVPSPVPVPLPDPVARYVVTVQSTWSEQTHPTDWPDSAHYSPLIGGTHSSGVTFWQDGRPATEGIRAMSERGRTSPLDLEVMAAITAGTAQNLLSGPDLRTSPDSASMEFDISVGFPLVTLVTMVAPSPDWFVGVSGLSLLVNNQWSDGQTIVLYPWDAGTDSGITYKAEDLRTLPAEPIQRLLGFPVAVNGTVPPFGTMTFRRLVVTR
ncbi:MAG: spondin domain-containing protein [Vicinamibacterales bacterium]